MEEDKIKSVPINKSLVHDTIKDVLARAPLRSNLG